MTIGIARLDADTAAPEDADAIDRILNDSRGAIVRRGEHLDGAAERLSEAASDPDRLLLVARAAPDGAIVGIADGRLGADGLTIAAIAVEPRQRRRHVARALLEAVEKAASVRAGGPISVLAGVHDDNGAALAFFEAHGFERRGASGGVIELSRLPR